jgi:hypothetical protein
MGRLRREEGDALAAANTFRKTCELLAKDAGVEATLALAELEHAEALVELGDSDAANAQLKSALKHAQSANAPALAARAMGVRASLREIAGDTGGAASLYRDAAQLAAEAGDAPGAARWRTAAESIK